MRRNNIVIKNASSGFSLPTTLAVVLLLALLGAAGYYIVKSQSLAEQTMSEESNQAMESAEKTEEPNAIMKDEGAAEKPGDAMMEEPVATKVFDLTGKNFSFSQTEIRIKKGDRVRINLASTEGFHDWTIDEFNAKTEGINTGEKASVEFVADKIGIFEYYCSVGQHRLFGMKGDLIVE